MQWVPRIVMSCLLLGSFGGCSRKASTDPIFIGHIAPFSGPDKTVGQHARQAIELAIETVNKEENRIGDRRVLVLHVDSQGEPDRLQPEAVRLSSINRVVALLGGTDADQAERLGKAAAAYEVAVVTPAELLPRTSSDDVFSVNVSPAWIGQCLARYAAHDLQAKHVAVFSDERYAAGVVVTGAFGKELAKTSESKVDILPAANDAEAAEAVERLVKQRPQAILLAVRPSELRKWRARLDKAALRVPILLALTSSDWAPLLLDAALEGTYLATPFVADPGEAFTRRYRDRFGEIPDIHAALAYDGIEVILSSLRLDKAVSPSRTRNGLGEGGSVFESLTGKFGFDNEHSARRPLFVVQVEQGQFKRSKRFDP